MKQFLVAGLLFMFTLPLFAKNTILIVGDSLSASYGFNAEKGWPNLLVAKLNAEHYDFSVVNKSISGDTTSNGLMRLASALKQSQPTITILELGANDALRGSQLSAIKSNLQKMISKIKQENSLVLLLGLRIPPYYGQTYSTDFQNMFIEVAHENQINIVPLFLNNVDTDKTLMQEDQLHPNEHAQQKILDNVWPTLKTMLDQITH